MNERYPGFLAPIALVGSCLFALYLSIFRAGYLNSTSYLGAMIFFWFLVAAVWNFRQRFLALLLIVFLWSGMDIPLQGSWTSGRWVVLAIGALLGFGIYMKDRHHHFGALHLVALFCVLAALISAMVSSYPQQAILKALSLLLLFLYGASGARLAAVGREQKFFAGALLACEVVTYGTAVSVFLFGIELFGNPNSRGAIMGVVVLPMLLWAMLNTERQIVRYRRTFALGLASLLLLSSYARAGLVAGTLACVLICVTLRRYRVLINGLIAAVLAAILVVSFVPVKEGEAHSLSTAFLYKGQQDVGVLGSRKTVWQKTSDSIHEHPWFGTGFGTSPTNYQATYHALGVRSADEATREHGNSYLAIAEWVGLLGVLPFLTLVLLVAVNTGRVFAWIRRTGSAASPVVPLAAIMAAGLVHAAFEDWLFAVGYHLCVFFWSMAFIFFDVMPAREPSHAEVGVAFPRPRGGGFFGTFLPQR